MMNSKSKSIKPEKEKNVQVFVRVRPLNNLEKSIKSCTAVYANGNKEVIVKERPTDKHTKTFTFDKVFGPESKQIDVYKIVVHPLIDEVLAGYNCTVFAYGQTGTGKTFTMEGEKSNDASISWEDDPLSGIIPRSLSQLFDELRLLQVEYTVRVSFLELYNEEIFDLLSPPDDATKLRLFEDTTRKGSVIIQGLEEVTVNNKQEVYKIMEKGSLKRTTAATLMNAQSSRSHTVFSITVHIKDNSIDGEELLKTGKLNLVDLAGSENISRSGAVDKRAREAGNINQSLLTLGRCITSLVEHCPHIPYRESKLTRLLQESLGGRTKTSIIATVSPAFSNLEETLSTLDYAHRAKNITNKPEINQKLTKRALLKEYTEEIERLRRDLEAAREKNGIYIAHENYNDMIIRMEQQEEEIMNKISTLKAIKEDMDKKEELLNTLGIKLNKAKDKIQKTITEREEKNFLIQKHIEIEQRLTEQARQLSNTVDESTKDTEKLHMKLENKRQIEESNFLAAKLFHKNFLNKNNELNSLIQESYEQQVNFLREQKQLMSDNYELQANKMENMQKEIQELNTFVKNFKERFYDFQENSELLLNLLKIHHEDDDNFLNMTQVNFKQIMEIEENFDVLSKNIEMLLTNYNQLKDNVEESIEVNYSLVTKSNESLSHLTNIQNKLNDFSNSLLTKLSNVTNLEREIHKSQLENKEISLNIVTEVQCKLNELQKLLSEKPNEKRTLLLNEFDQVNETVEHIESTVRLIEDVKVENENCNQEINCNNSSLKSLINKDFDSFTNNVETCCNEVSTINSTLKNTTRQLVDSVNDYKNKSSSYHRNNVVQLQQQNQNITLLASNVEKNLNNHVSESSNKLKEFLTSSEDFVTERLEVFSSQYNTVLKRINDVQESSKLQAESVDRFVNNDLQRDVATGQTPQRRHWQYPKHLVTMSPHESLLKKFYRENPVIHYDSLDESELNGTITEDNDSS